ncbi:hypothetical protein C1Y63_01750 [Corynebacterium sp. 13CS0277]|uniref:carboxylesterase/lipase family protein n=1 Tax=Corynebacterium sp. 13CS0277 TaxID=2071994 RepID=UPI000D03978D|nr:carboxylesterase family protein [Corynebacterium sp. 13CS0277]PRQ12304.1 hypothetical protein C1Y63_01750 [Corynebacterium sp. 13CS0277]
MSFSSRASHTPHRATPPAATTPSSSDAHRARLAALRAEAALPVPPPGPLVPETSDGIRRWRGVPFGRIIPGAGRWRAPQTLPAWEDTRVADTYQPPAAQPGYSWQDRVHGVEDCLTLDIVRPDDGRTLPVVVYFHGGSFLVGASHQEILRGHKFVRDLDVVYVAVNFRLGVLGYVDVTHLEPPGEQTAADVLAGTAGTESRTVANPALYDQVLALRWVRDNIHAFGGDAGNVTIMGESAGAQAVLALMACPVAEGLFHKAIAQSAPAATFHHPEQAAFWAQRLADHVKGDPTPPDADTDADTGAADTPGRPTAAQGSCDDAAATIAPQGAPTDNDARGQHPVPPGRAGTSPLARLRAVPVDALISAGQRMILRNPSFGPLNSSFGPAVEPGMLPMHPVDAFAQGTVAPVPLLIGTNNDEASVAKLLYLRAAPRSARARTILRAYDPEHADHVLAAYKHARRRTDFAHLLTDAVFWGPSVRIAEAHARHGHPVWMYRYDFASAWMRKIGMGATHSMELAYLFNDVDASRISSVHKMGDDSRFGAVTTLMQRHWGAFIHGGAPQADWPAYRIDDAPGAPGGSQPQVCRHLDRATLIINAPHEVAYDPRAYQRIAWEGYTMTEWGRGIPGFLAATGGTHKDLEDGGAEESADCGTGSAARSTDAAAGASAHPARPMDTADAQDAAHAEATAGGAARTPAPQSSSGEPVSAVDLKRLVKAAHAESKQDTKESYSNYKARTKQKNTHAKHSQQNAVTPAPADVPGRGGTFAEGEEPARDTKTQPTTKKSTKKTKKNKKNRKGKKEAKDTKTAKTTKNTKNTENTENATTTLPQTAPPQEQGSLAVTRGGELGATGTGLTAAPGAAEPTRGRWRRRVPTARVILDGLGLDRGRGLRGEQIADAVDVTPADNEHAAGPAAQDSAQSTTTPSRRGRRRSVKESQTTRAERGRKVKRRRGDR